MNYPVTNWHKRPPALTRAEMEALMREAIAALPPAGEADISTPEGVALYRMRTLARREWRGIPENAEVMRAMWLFIGVTAFPNDMLRTRARLREAAQAAATLTHSAAGSDREALRSALGEVGEAASRLLYAGMILLGGK